MLKKSNELIRTRFLLLIILMFSVLFNLNIVRIIKDSLVVTLLGAETISFIKLWMEMPIATILFIIYTKLKNHFKTETLFQLLVTGFLFFFCTFLLIIFPRLELFFLEEVVTNNFLHGDSYFNFFTHLYKNWMLALFYVICSLWPVVVYSLLFWQLMNKMHRLQEAVTVYPIMNSIGQFSLLISGATISFLCRSSRMPFKWAEFPQQHEKISILYHLSLLVVATSVITLCMLYFLKHTDDFPQEMQDRQSVQKNIGLGESLQTILSCKILGYILLLVISYSVTINLIEGLWLAQVRALYSELGPFMHYQGRVIFWTGIFTLLCTMVSGYILKKKDWQYAALMTPVTTLIFGGLFFVFVYLEQKIPQAEWNSSHFPTPLICIVIFGAVQNIFIKGVKYAFFDITKEMVYIPLTHELKGQGKAAVELVGTRVGKLMSILLQCLLLMGSPGGSYADVVLPLLLFFLLSCFLWLWGVIQITRYFNGKNALFTPSSMMY